MEVILSLKNHFIIPKTPTSVYKMITLHIEDAYLPQHLTLQMLQNVNDGLIGHNNFYSFSFIQTPRFYFTRTLSK